MSTPVNNTGVLVDSKEKLVFEAYKNKPVFNSDKFKQQIRKNHGFIPSSELYRAIVNYQIKKYGQTLNYPNHIEYVEKFGEKTPENRRKHIKDCVLRDKVNRFVARNEK